MKLGIAMGTETVLKIDVDDLSEALDTLNMEPPFGAPVGTTALELRKLRLTMAKMRDEEIADLELKKKIYSEELESR